VMIERSKRNKDRRVPVTGDLAGLLARFDHLADLRRPDREWFFEDQHSKPSRQPATGPPGSYPDRTFTGRRRRAYELEETPWHYVTVSPPILLGARKNAH
jgi:hypothetical protein